MFRKRIIEEFEWKLQQAKADYKELLDAEYAEKFDNQVATFEKATEIQQSLYDKKIRQLEEVAKTAYQKGRTEVLDLVKAKIKSGEIVRGRTTERPQVSMETQE